MYSFRAINEIDFNNFKKNNSIYCSNINDLIRLSNMDEEEKIRFFKECLDTLIGHISGKKLKNNSSFWISSSKDLSFVMYEYAIPQNGNYNMFKGRKPIVIIKEGDNQDDCSLCLKNNKQVKINKSIRDDYHFQYLSLDLSNDGLEKIVKDGISFPENIWQYGFDSSYLDLHGLSGFASKAFEVVHFISIPKSRIVGFLTPLACDILYPLILNKTYQDVSSVVDWYLEDIEQENSIIKQSLDFVFDNLSLEEQQLFKLCYNDINSYKFDIDNDYSYYANTLTNIVYEDKRNISKIDYYKKLIDFKRYFLYQIYDYLSIGIGKEIPLVDNQVYFLSYKENKVIPDIDINKIKNYKNDVVLVEDEQGNLYTHSIYDSKTKKMRIRQK